MTNFTVFLIAVGSTFFGMFIVLPILFAFARLFGFLRGCDGTAMSGVHALRQGGGRAG